MKHTIKIIVAVCAIAAVLFHYDFNPINTPLPSVSSPEIQSNEDTTIHFIDVGQGDAELVVSGDSAVLIDAGKKSAGDTVVNYLRHHNITKLDAIIASHPHEDHIGGLIDVFDAFDVEAIYMSDEATDTMIFEDLLDAIDAEGISPQFPEIGDTIPLGDSDAHFTVLAPGADSRSHYSNDPNTWSLVVRLDAGGCSALFTGDTTTAVEKDMLSNNPVMLNCDILKVAHHGSRTSSNADFLQAVSPKYAVISYETGNSYGLPDEEIFERLTPLGTQILETAKQGSIALTLSNGKVVVQ